MRKKVITFFLTLVLFFQVATVNSLAFSDIGITQIQSTEIIGQSPSDVLKSKGISLYDVLMELENSGKSSADTAETVTGSKKKEVGDVIGKVLATDILTYIDDVLVPAYNVNNRTAVLLKDIDAYGFSVKFDEESREVLVSQDDDFTADGKGVSSLGKYQRVGAVVGNVLHTDIVAKFDSAVLTSFNIEGRTAVYITELAEKCDAQCIWNENEKKVFFYSTEQKKQGIDYVDAKRKLPGKVTAVTQEQSQRRWGEPSASHLIANSDGTYFTVEIDEDINIEKYDSKFKLISSFTISREMELFGGLYSGEKYNYIAFGQNNSEEKDDKEVIRIVVYDKEFKKIREISVSDCKTTVPFDASAGEMCENDKYLILHTSRSQYKDENGLCPQTQLTVIIDKNTWKPCNSMGVFQSNHTSHSLRELAVVDGDGFVTVDLSDAAPSRGVILRKMNFDGTVEKMQTLFNIPGKSGANATGVMPGGLFAAKDGYLVALSSIKHSDSVEYGDEKINGMDREIRDIYLLTSDKDLKEQKHYNITDYSGKSISAGTPYLVALNEKTVMVLWQEFEKSGEAQGVVYAIADAKSGIIKTSGLLQSVNGEDTILLSPDCEPVFADNKVTWYINTQNGRIFYCIDTRRLTGYIENVQEKNTGSSLIDEFLGTGKKEVETKKPQEVSNTAQEETKKQEADNKTSDEDNALLKYKEKTE